MLPDGIKPLPDPLRTSSKSDSQGQVEEFQLRCKFSLKNVFGNVLKNQPFCPSVNVFRIPLTSILSATAFVKRLWLVDSNRAIFLVLHSFAKTLHYNEK